MGFGMKSFLFTAACVLLCNAQPVKEQPIFQHDGSLIYFRDSQPIRLPCQIGSSSGAIGYSWEKDGHPLDLERKDLYQQTPEGLTILKPHPGDEGIYQCFCKTSQGVASSKLINLQRSYVNTKSIKIKKEKLTPEEGKPLKLECPIPEGHPKPEITWEYKERSQRITQGPDGALYFSNVTKEDAQNSKYISKAKTPASELPIELCEYTLDGVKEVKEKNGELVPQYLSQEMTVKAGSVAMLYCIYGGTPLAYPDWFFEGKNVNGSPKDRVTRHNRTGGKRLLIKEVLYSDQGTYTCKVNNEVGKPQKHTIKLNVVGAPNFVKTPEPIITTPTNQDLTIDCQIESLPLSEITWTFNALPLKENDRISTTLKQDKNTSIGKLLIKKVDVTDKGYYGCKAVNEHGENYAESLLIVS